jgi:non-lysosomal glucosylceramidase
MLGEGEKRPRKMSGAVPHDLGSPTEDPFHRTNIYNFQDVSRWKDLGPKFILQIYRDYKHTKSPWFLVDMFPVMLQVMENTALFDRNGDGMIENEGFPDQTYDIWIASGVHAYCGGLWIAACLAMSAIGKVLGDEKVTEKYALLSERAKEVYTAKLWNGEYFNYDSSTSGHHDSIMADMMAGHWYSILCGLPPIIPADKALSCYRKIYSHNVEMFGKGHMMGAVNGMRPDGTIDSSCLQSREVSIREEDRLDSCVQ